MRRRLFTLASAISLLLCVATVVLWVRSYWIADEQHLLSPSLMVVLRSAWGRESAIIVLDHTEGQQWSASRSRSWSSAATQLTPTPPNRLGFALRLSKTRASSVKVGWHVGNRPFIAIAAPHWFVAAALALLTVPWIKSKLAHRQRMRRAGQRQCISCGYDLTGNTSGVCPECGTPLPDESETPA